MKNATVIETAEYLLLVSYKTPVAYLDKSTKTVYKTDKKWSVTTSKHISQFMTNHVCRSGIIVACNPIAVDQSVLDDKFSFNVKAL